MRINKCFIFLHLLLLSISFDLVATPQKNILYINSYNSSFPTYFKQIEGVKVKGLLLHEWSFKEFKVRLENIETSTPFLLLSAFRDKNNCFFRFEESLALIKNNLDAPLFHLWNHGIEDGVFGGKLISQYEQGKQAGLIIDRLIKGENIADIPVKVDSPNRYAFNKEELNEFHIKESSLPYSSLVINRKDSRFLILYKSEIIIGIIFLFIQAILIFYLFGAMRIRFKVENDLRLQISEYYSLNEEYLSLNEDYQNTNEKLRDANIDLIEAETKLKGNMSELALKREELRLSEERFRLAITGANEGIWDWNLATNEVFLSPKWKEMLGYEDHELKNEVNAWEKLLNVDDLEIIMQKVKDLVDGETDVYEAEFKLIHKKGHMVYILSRGLAMKDEKGQVYRIVGTHQDLTDRYVYEQKLREQVEENLSLYEEYRTISEELDAKNKYLLDVEEELRIYIAKLNNRNIELDESKQKYQQLFNNLSEAFCLYEIVIDVNNIPKDFIIRDANIRFLETHNVSLENVINKKASEVFPYKIEYWLDDFGDVALNGGSKKIIDYVAELDKYYEIHVFSPKKFFFAVIFDDITESVRAKDALLAEKSRTEDIIKGTNAGTWEWDLVSSELIINDIWAELIGYTVDELAPMDADGVLKLIHPDERDIVDAELKSAIAKEIEYYDVEFRLKHKDEHWVWIHSRGGAVEFDDSGKPIRMTGTHVDISDKKEVEIALVESEKRFKTMFDKSKTVMLLINPKTGNIVDANDTALDYYGYDKAEMLKLNMNKVNMLSLSDIKTEMNNALTEKRSNYKFQHILKSGDIRNVDVYVSPIVVNNDELLHSIIIDTTKSVEAEYQIQQVNKRFVGLEHIVHYSASSINDLLDFTLNQCVEFTDSELGAVYHFDSDKSVFYLNNWSQDVNLVHKYISDQEDIQNMDCLNKAVKLREAVIVNNPESLYPFQKLDLLRGGRLKSITIPILYDNKVVCLFWLATRNGFYSKFHTEQLMLLLDTAWILVEKQRLQDKMR